ncbi:MAG: FecR family protein [Sandaracinaceae bacterium]|nr:FecR family protein [Sandaracinaceae bacterium]
MKPELPDPPDLPDPIADVLKDTADEARVRRLWRGIEARRASPRRSRAPALAAAVALAAGVLLWIAWPRASAPGPLALAGGGALSTMDGPREVLLDDGSRIVLEQGARVEPLQSSATAVTLLLARGRARFEVQPGGPRRWSIESGVATVEVVGTVFTVERGVGWARVEVERGVVVVRGERVPDRAARLARGDALTIGEGEIARAGEPAGAVAPSRRSRRGRSRRASRLPAARASRPPRRARTPRRSWRGRTRPAARAAPRRPPRSSSAPWRGTTTRRRASPPSPSGAWSSTC